MATNKSFKVYSKDGSSTDAPSLYYHLSNMPPSLLSLGAQVVMMVCPKSTNMVTKTLSLSPTKKNHVVGVK
eukprot:scaffold13754_cov79-Skeletonema_marinoi.AAC.1